MVFKYQLQSQTLKTTHSMASLLFHSRRLLWSVWTTFLQSSILYLYIEVLEVSLPVSMNSADCRSNET